MVRCIFAGTLGGVKGLTGRRLPVGRLSRSVPRFENRYCLSVYLSNGWARTCPGSKRKTCRGQRSLTTMSLIYICMCESNKGCFVRQNYYLYMRSFQKVGVDAVGSGLYHVLDLSKVSTYLPGLESCHLHYHLSRYLLTDMCHG